MVLLLLFLFACVALGLRGSRTNAHTFVIAGLAIAATALYVLIPEFM